MTERGKSVRDAISAVTTTVLFAVILTLVVFAARSYQHASDQQDSSSNTRAVLSYVVSSVRDSGSSEISVADRSGIECLVISGEGYEQRFYLHDGSLMEEYIEPGLSPDPDTALEIGTTSVLGFTLSGNGLLTITTDEGSATVNTGRRR